MSGRIRSALALAALGVMGAVACDSSDDAHGSGPDGGNGGTTASGGVKGEGGSGDGGSSGETGATGGKAGSATGGITGAGGAGGGVVCGGETCTTSSADTGVQARPCCTDEGACGVRIPLSPRCLPRNQFGTTNVHCEAYDIPNFTLPGCCRADGCGARITFENLGCISNADLSRPAVPCNQYGTPAGDGG